jgi:hypothetical protein
MVQTGFNKKHKKQHKCVKYETKRKIQKRKIKIMMGTTGQERCHREGRKVENGRKMRKRRFWNKTDGEAWLRGFFFFFFCVYGPVGISSGRTAALLGLLC